MNLNGIKQAKRVVIKVGTSTLTYETGKANFRRMGKLAQVLSDLRNSGLEIVLGTSGALGIGIGLLGLKERPRDTPSRQAVATVGQCELMFMYDKLFGEYGHTVGQLLITKGDTEHPERRQNLINTLGKIFEYGVLPIINENDSVAVDEIENVFGDNDNLSAIVAELVRADALILLTDTDGLCNADPREDPDAAIIPFVQKITPEITALAGKPGTRRGTGGMVTKLQAAKFATEAGIDTVILNGANPEDLYRLFDGRQIGTYFMRQEL